jgi:predicted Zn-dependent protease
LLRRGGDHRGAVAELRLVLRAQPGSIPDRLALVTSLVAIGDQEDADRELTALELAAPTSAEVAFARAATALRSDHAVEAARAAHRALSLRTPFPAARLVLAEALLRAGARAEGRRELTRFAAEAPPSMEHERQRAEAFLREEAR